ncbi:hypothetical protein DSM104299_04997 [Baekduia alba]|uniref:hypothetical protein n=1 Tax=Baekduia alba TaxID=2997333 RepID=UPI00234109DE|nr:hypothetical protein [Baekduia alba]WCB96240.1 hypothetical protein DSM104299_04997 [Baekduia alba]
MHHHRLVLNGPPPAVARLVDDLRAAGAEGITREPPVRLVWTTAHASAVEALCARHRRVVVGVERFETLGAELERLVVCGREATVLERRAFADEELAPLGPEALRRVALGVAAMPVALGSGLAGTALDDALLVGPALGRLCAAAGDPLAVERPPRAAVDAIRALAAVALTVGANASAPASDAELAFERSWRLAQAAAFAAQDAWWARPDDDDWPEWLMFLLSCAAGVVESCAACLHRPPPDVKSLIAEHHATADEQLDHAAGLLTIVTLQALTLFDDDAHPGRGRTQ